MKQDMLDLSYFGVHGDTLHDTTRVMQHVSPCKYPKTYVTRRKYVARNMSHQLKETYLQKMAGVSCKLRRPVNPPYYSNPSVARTLMARHSYHGCFEPVLESRGENPIAADLR